jgi:hypothetical protein
LAPLIKYLLYIHGADIILHRASLLRTRGLPCRRVSDAHHSIPGCYTLLKYHSSIGHEASGNELACQIKNDLVGRTGERVRVARQCTILDPLATSVYGDMLLCIPRCERRRRRRPMHQRLVPRRAAGLAVDNARVEGQHGGARLGQHGGGGMGQHGGGGMGQPRIPTACLRLATSQAAGSLPASAAGRSQRPPPP